MKTEITPDKIILAVCEALELDRDKLITDKVRNRTKKGIYTEACCISVYLLREKILVPKKTKMYGSELKPPTYKQVASILKKKSHKTVMYWEIDCKAGLKDKDSPIKKKYDMVVNLLDRNVNIA